MSQQCPFLSTVEEKVACFKECSFYEFEGSGEGCPFKKIKGDKGLNIKEILSFDLDSKKDEDFEDDDFEGSKDFIESIYAKDFL